MKVGAERKKIAILAGLGLVAAYLFYTNVFDSGEAAPSASGRPAASAPGTVVAPKGVGPVPQDAARPNVTRLGSNRRESREFRPSLKRRPEDALDSSSVDPTLRLDLLTRLESVSVSNAGRNLFEFGSAPPVQVAEGEKKPEPKIIPVRPVQGPKPPPTEEEMKATSAAAKPKAPPIPLRYFGFINPARGGTVSAGVAAMAAGGAPGTKRAFFLDNEEVLVANEGELLKKRYKVVRIGINSVEMEDTTFSGDKQILPLVEQPAGS